MGNMEEWQIESSGVIVYSFAENIGTLGKSEHSKLSDEDTLELLEWSINKYSSRFA